MSAVNNQVMTCPSIDPNSTQTSDYLLQKWTNANGGKGVMSDTLPVDQDTGLITAAAIAGQVQTLINNGTIPMAKPDSELYSDLQSEFCWYQSRYLYALNQFLQAATLRQATDAGPANAMLATTQTLNKRANSVLQIISYLAQSRVSNIMSSKSGIDNLNTDINKKLAELQAGYALLNKDDALLTTQKEMVRYTEEKNNYTNNRIAVWTALNVLALGAIFYVYQKA
jgi:hypothetical protein